jgi:hypothetical protein
VRVLSKIIFITAYLVIVFQAQAFVITSGCSPVIPSCDSPCSSSTDLSVKIFYPALYFSKRIEQSLSSADSISTQQNTISQDSEINRGRLWLVGGTLTASMVVIHLYQQNGWWKNNRAPFHFQEDLVYGLNVDKIGHFYGAYLMAFAVQKCLEWANEPEVKALWLGSVGGLLFQTYVEVEDGFSTWGFDRVDFASDVGGAAWPIARYYVPYLQNFDLKFSYHPSLLLGTAGGSGFKGQKHIIIDDYEGQTL